MAFKQLKLWFDDPQPIFPILQNLKDDPSKYVQKSVANNLNDILKDNYSNAIQLIEDWTTQPTSARKWIIKHALRNQIKLKNKKAETLLESLK